MAAIEAMAKRIALERRAEENLVAIRPNHHRRVVAVLPHHLIEHIAATRGERIGLGNRIDEGYLDGAKKSDTIAEVHDILALRIVGNTKEVSPHCLDHQNVFALQ